MKKKQNGRAAACCALLALLTVSGYAGAALQEPIRTVSVPVVFEPIESDELAFMTQQDAQSRLAVQRERVLAMLEDVIARKDASPSVLDAALEQKTRIASAMESEARLEAALELLGMKNVKAIRGEEGMTVFASGETLLDGKMRIQIVDAAVSAAGISAESVKIILAKNE